MNDDNIYWLFSAAAQSVAAFIALLLAGYALVHALLEAARTRDDTLEEVHRDLRSLYHRRLTLLAWMNGSAIFLSLLVVYLNKWSFAGKGALMSLAAAADVAAMTGGLTFVVKIVDPRRYAQAAERALREISPEFDLSGEPAPPAEFFEQWKALGRALRELLQRHDLYRESADPARRHMSFREMLEALAAAELADASFLERLADVNRYRNLVFHGHFPEADRGMIERVRQSIERVRRIV